MRRKNLATARVDHKKACHMVAQSWIIDRLQLYKISDEVIKVIEKTIKKWRVQLTAEGKSIAKVKIQRGIFQGDALMPILFIIAMMPFNYILWKFRGRYKLIKWKEKINHLCKWTTLNCLQKWKRIKYSKTRCENVHSGHRDGIWYIKMCLTKLYCRKLIKGISTRSVSLIRYSGPFLKWTKEEFKQMNKRTRKLMTMHKALHPRNDVDRFYVSRKEGGRRLSSIEDSVDPSIRQLEDYI